MSGVDGAKFGLMMSGRPTAGARYYQEVAPKGAMDRAAAVSIAETAKVPAGTFKECVRVRETTPLEPGAAEYKVHAPGIDLVQDGDLQLVRYGRNIDPRR